METRVIDEYSSIEGDGDTIEPSEHYVVVQKRNGATYKMLIRDISVPGVGTIQYLTNPFLISSDISGDIDVRTSSFFSNNVSAVLLSVGLLNDSSKPSAVFSFFTSSQKTEDYEHKFYLNEANSATSSGNFIWVPVVDGVLRLRVDSNSTRAFISACASI